MKTLYLLRHAKAEDGQDDFERCLSARGESDARRMGQALMQRGIKPDIIYCSSATRARSTIEILVPQMGIEMGKVCFDEELYLAAPDALAEFVLSFDNRYESALICGHNPGLEYLAAFYLNKDVEKFPTCAFREIRFKADSWAFAAPETAEKTDLITPKSLLS